VKICVGDQTLLATTKTAPASGTRAAQGTPTEALLSFVTNSNQSIYGSQQHCDCPSLGGGKQLHALHLFEAGSEEVLERRVPTQFGEFVSTEELLDVWQDVDKDVCRTINKRVFFQKGHQCTQPLGFRVQALQNNCRCVFLSCSGNLQYLHPGKSSNKPKKMAKPHATLQQCNEVCATFWKIPPSIKL